MITSTRNESGFMAHELCYINHDIDLFQMEKIFFSCFYSYVDLLGINSYNIFPFRYWKVWKKL